MKDSGIQWTDHTFNPWIGCTKKSNGCKNCYATGSTPVRVMRSAGKETWGKGAPRQRTSETYWREPLKWNRDAAKAGVRTRVFCASLADWLDDEVEIAWLADLLVLIYATPHLDWLLLTKRPENWCDRLHTALRENDRYDLAWEVWLSSWLDGDAPANVWFGVTIEDQPRAIERFPIIAKIPARVRFASFEPLLEELDLREWLAPPMHAGVAHHYRTGHIGGGGGDGYQCDECDFERDESMPIHWGIIGGESGSDARLSNVGTIRRVMQQCQAAGVAAFVKQLGAHIPDLPFHPIHHKKGGDITEWPEDLRIRQFPILAATTCSRREIQAGDRVHVYWEKYYNHRGVVLYVRAVDAMGRVDVKLDSGRAIKCHMCDLELIP